MWRDDDMGYLKQAKAAVSKEFWELVSKKMRDMGCMKKIPGVSCQQKWRELERIMSQVEGTHLRENRQRKNANRKYVKWLAS